MTHERLGTAPSTETERGEFSVDVLTGNFYEVIMPEFKRLSRESLFSSKTDALERLAIWLRVRLPAKCTYEGDYRARLVTAIQRAEKELIRVPRE